MRTALTVAILAAALAHGPLAQACSCAPMTPLEIAESADIAFVGREAARTEPADSGDDAVEVTFAIERLLAGQATDPLVVRTGRGGGDCGVEPLGAERTVGVLAWDGRQGPTINICGSIAQPGELVALFEANPELAAQNPPSLTRVEDPDTAVWLAAGALGLAAAAAVAGGRPPA